MAGSPNEGARELFTLDARGEKQDAALHAAILGADATPRAELMRHVARAVADGVPLAQALAAYGLAPDGWGR